MKPPITTTLVRGQRRNSRRQAPRRSPANSGAACVWRLSVTITSRESTCDRRQAEMAERQRHDVARQPLAVARDGVDGARRQLAQHRQALHQFGQFLEMLVERAVEFGALGQRHHLARFAGMEIAQVVNLPDVIVAPARDGRRGNGQQLVGGLAHGRNHHHRLALDRAPSRSPPPVRWRRPIPPRCRRTS